MHYDIVIAGGGFAGAYCARTLGRAWGKAGPQRVALIAERNVLVFQPMLAEVAGSTLAPLDVVNPLRHFCRGVSVFQGAIQRIDWEKKAVVVDGGPFTRHREIGFNQLVLTLGSATDLRGIPGMADYGRPMKDLADAVRLRSVLINRLEEANLTENAEDRTRLMTYVVVGGGYTGVETAGQIGDFLREAYRYYNNLKETPPQILLVHAGTELLPEIGPALGKYAREVLVERGTEVRLNTKVVAVTARRVHLEDGMAVEANTVVTTIGSGPNPVVLDLCRQLGLEAPKGRVRVRPTLRVPGHDDLWAAGDGASVPWDDRGQAKVSPPTAQFAVRQGVQLAKNILRADREQPLRPFRHRYMGQLAVVGKRHAVAEVMGWHFRGLIAWWLWRTIYLSKLPGAARRLRVTIDWTFDLFFPRDTSLVMPPANEVLRAVHLDRGDPLFALGDQCRVLFYLRKGAVVLSPAAGPAETVGAGAVIDGNWLDGDGKWSCSATAAEPSDLIVFRGLALELFRAELQLVPRERSPQPATAS